MSQIKLEPQADACRLQDLGVHNWGIWSKEVSSFPWQYDATETCYFLEGDVLVTPENGEPVRMGKGDLVTFPSGMTCHWEILSDVKKHFNFDE
ncbi:MAG: cupin domain-containing protein [Gammaproteobacteria bacterium]|nr:cupin domain-containing protein [Gammaproteobacteria bacterium]